MPTPLQWVLLPLLACAGAVIAALFTGDDFVLIAAGAGAGSAIWYFITPLGYERED